MVPGSRLIRRCPSQRKAREAHACVFGLNNWLTSTDFLVRSLQETTAELLGSNFLGSNVKIYYIPIGLYINVQTTKFSRFFLEWHSVLHENEVDKYVVLFSLSIADHLYARIVSQISLNTLPLVRNLNHTFLIDILLFTVKHSGQMLVDLITQKLNHAYERFLEEHPMFSGDIGCFAHSLGGLALYDILAHQPGHGGRMCSKASSVTDIHYRPLKFIPKFLVTLGSPLAMIFSLRGIDYAAYPLANDCRYYNVFNPLDPFGYRFEPLVDTKFGKMNPVVIPTWKVGHKRLHNRLQERFATMMPHVGDVSMSFSVSWLSRLYEQKGSASDALSPSTIDPSNALSDELIEYRQSIRLDTKADGAVSSDVTESNPHKKGVSRKRSARSSARKQNRQKLEEPSMQSSDLGDSLGNFPSRPSMERFMKRAGEAAFDFKQRIQNAFSASFQSTCPTTYTGEPDSTVAVLEYDAVPTFESWHRKNPLEPEPYCESGSLSAASKASSDTLVNSRHSGRFDFVLQQTVFGSEYFTGVRSHHTYWSNKDVANFLLQDVLGIAHHRNSL